MARFFTDHAPVGEQICLTGDDAHHIAKVLRMKIGDALTVCDCAGNDYACSLSAVTKEGAVCDVLGITPSEGEPKTAVTLYMGLPKGDKMDFIVQKAVELGAVRIVPFTAERSVSRPDARTLAKKCERWQKIAREAAMQCGRGMVPEIGEPLTQEQAAKKAAACELALLLYENEWDTGIRAILAGKTPESVALMIGPEGGFTLHEAETAKAAGLHSVSLGKRILRCETAPVAALAVVLYETGNM